MTTAGDYDDLRDYLADRFELPDDEGARRFFIDSDAKADWAMRKIRQAREQVDAIQAQAAELIDEVQFWASERCATPAGTISQMSSYLEIYHRRLTEMELAEVPWDKVISKTIVLPCGGKLVARRSKAIPEYAAKDDDAIVAWLEAHGFDDAIDTKRRVVRDKVKALIKAGDIVIGPSGVLHAKDDDEIAPGVRMPVHETVLDGVDFTVEPGV